MNLLPLLGGLAGGVGLFLLGMGLMTDGLKLAAGPALERILARSTQTRLRGLATGALVTIAVQSSSAVTVAAIGFVNAGLLTLSQALWVLFGANVGTTMTGWLVALVGMKFSIDIFALPLIGLGMLLWSGIGSFIAKNDVKLMFGCASLPGTDPQQHKEALSYLYYQHLAPPGLRPKALPGRYVDMRLLPPESVNVEEGIDKVRVDPRLGGSNLPPLIKGYLRLGGFVGDGAVVDEQFNTTDVCIIVKRESIADRYLKHYERARRGPELD